MSMFLRAALTFTLGVGLVFGTSLNTAQAQVSPSNEDEEVADSFYESLSTGEKIGVAVGIVAVCTAIYFALDAGNDSSASTNSPADHELLVGTAPTADSLPVLADVWAGDGVGGVVLQARW